METKEHTVKYMENAIKSKENPTEMPEGTEKKPKGHHQSAQRATRVPPRCKIDDNWSPKAAQRVAKGDQDAPKMVPKWTQNASRGPAAKNL